MKSTEFVDALTFHLVPPTGQSFHLSTKIGFYDSQVMYPNNIFNTFMTKYLQNHSHSHEPELYFVLFLLELLLCMKTNWIGMQSPWKDMISSEFARGCTTWKCFSLSG